MTDLGKIKAFAFDIDGVFTDGSVHVVAGGDLYRTFESKDCLGVRMARMHGFPCGIITGASVESLRNRFYMMGIPDEDIYLHSREKIADFMAFCEFHCLSPEEVAFAGDDLPDIPVLQKCGLSVCPSDAVDEVKQVCDIVSTVPGGRSFVRSMVESVMKAQGCWTMDMAKYKAMF